MGGFKDFLKSNKGLVRLYQKMIGYNAGNEHWCRVVMDQSTDALVRSLPCQELDALEISGGKWKSLGFKSYRTTNFPEFDICKEQTSQKFDIIIAEQVFEHLKWPHRASQNIYGMLNPGGYFLISVPFLIKIHNDPIDCTRWTSEGLAYFLEEAGFDLDKIQTGSWGNRESVIANFDEWMPFNPKRHSLANESDFPLVTWALARKQLT
jgi:SAM-dependent methyltransferase